MKTIGYGIVGTGYFGAELGRIMAQKEGAKIVAVYDPENGKTIAEELGCDAESDLDSLCAREDVDAVIVATPNYLHKDRFCVLPATRRTSSARSPSLFPTRTAMKWSTPARRTVWSLWPAML